MDLQIVDAEIETAEVLRAIKSRITKDFVVISGDLITDVKMYHLADVHRINDATCTILLRAPKKTPPPQVTLVAPSESSTSRAPTFPTLNAKSRVLEYRKLSPSRSWIVPACIYAAVAASRIWMMPLAQANPCSSLL